VRGRWALGALVVVLASSAGAATAAPEAAATHRAAAARLITLTVATDTDEDVTQIVEYLRPVLEMRGYLLAVRRVDSLASAEPARSGSQPGVRSRVWLDLRTPKQAQVLYAAGDQPATARRVVPTAARIDQVAAAEIAEVILAALLAPQGSPAAAAPSGDRAAELAVAAGGEQGIWQRSVGIVGAAKSWAEGASAVLEVGLSVVLAWRPVATAWSRAVWATLRYRPPFEPDQTALGVRVRGGDGEVLALFAHGVGRRGSLGLAAGAGLEARFADPRPAAATTLARPQSVRELVVSLRSALRFDLRVEGPLNLFAALTLDLLPLQGRLAVSDSGATRPVFTPRPLRPGALAGVSFAF
jgi:hypothetical protein